MGGGADCDRRRVRPSVRMEQLGSFSGHIFIKFDIRLLFEKSFEQVQVSIKSEKNDGSFTFSGP